MDMFEKRQIRKENNSKKQIINSTTININWYPGHMEKAKRQILDQIKVVDIVIEIRDARIPISSYNPILNELVSHKPHLTIINKIDLADENRLNEVLCNIENVLYLNCVNKNITKVIEEKCKDILHDKLEKARLKGIRNKIIRAMVIGIPNVGKSTFINNVVKKSVAKVENHAGVTKALNWIRINQSIELLDTPGILWPKIDDQNVALKLALLGSINDQILDKQEICRFGLDYLYKNYKNLLIDRYGDLDENDLIASIAKNRNFIISNNELDINKTCEVVLKEIRNGIIGKFVLD